MEAAPLELKLRRIVHPAGDTNKWEVAETAAKWEAKETAVIICDMWARHWCDGACKRGAEMAPRMNQVLEKTRDMGVLIIHAPSSCMEPYKDHPGRKRAQEALEAYASSLSALATGLADTGERKSAGSSG